MKQSYTEKIIEGLVEKTLCESYIMDFVEFKFDWIMDWALSGSLVGTKNGKLTLLFFQFKREAIIEFNPKSFLGSLEGMARKHGLSLNPTKKRPAQAGQTKGKRER